MREGNFSSSHVPGTGPNAEEDQQQAPRPHYLHVTLIHMKDVSPPSWPSKLAKVGFLKLIRNVKV